MIRRAFALTAGQRYIVMAVNFGTVAVLSRILTPHEIGIAAVGSAIALVAISAREFAATHFLIQRTKLTPEEVRGAVTVMVLLTVLISAALAIFAPLISGIFGNTDLTPYLQIMAITFPIEICGLAVMALMQRDMEFDKLAILGVASCAVGSGCTIAMALIGFSYMSMAWGWLFAAATNAILGICMRRDWWIFLPFFGRWRDIIVFGGYTGVICVLNRVYETLPYVVVGRILSLNAAGIYNRSLNLSQLPQKMLMSSVFNLMLPIFASQHREGVSVKEYYLTAVSLITAILWPALVLLAILAHPAVDVVLGNQWFEVVPVVQIMALALMFAFASELNGAVLISIGRIRDIMLRSLFTVPLSGVVFYFASRFGLTILALSLFITIPLQEILILHAVRHRVGIKWRELLVVLRLSTIITACSAAGPLVMAAAVGFHFEFSIAMALLAALLSAVGWLAGIWFTQHLWLTEIHQVISTIRMHRNRSVKGAYTNAQID